MNHKAKKFFINGKRFLSNVDISEASQAFENAYHNDKSPRILAYLVYTKMLQSNYKAISQYNNQKMQGFGLYAIYWFKFLSGALDELEPLLQQMLQDDNYFLRVFAIKELYNKNYIHNLNKMLREHIDFVGLNYEISIEEERASIYLDILNKRKNLALLQIKKLIRDYPGFSELYLDLIEILSFYGNKILIREILEDKIFLKQASKDFRLMFALSREFYRFGQYKKAADYLNTLIFHFRNNPLFYFNLGNIYVKQEKYPKALDCYKESIALAPLFERAYYNMGSVFLKLGYVSDSIHILKEAIRIEKKQDSIYNLSMALIESKNLEDAYEHLNYLYFHKKGLHNKADNIRNQIREMLILS